ncbi:MinD/ParA family ATP-binding protein [Leptothoe spongobia]|uniref:MinD/ParA family protein n=1 Tax=Leptothoe spongobia TAU-MAC 1115 TaxID=1967444 RepID=A0A947DB90_9CYAN|nr:MinD/ParA family protein [Leptothoe spongobia]MBT9314075.1 MinD/ParA family protein [Leptothoe spongobia TAU-MAC 1115]
MSTIVSIHSFRGGTGKSSTSANVAVNLAQLGYRVGVIDTDIQSPGIHILFKLTDQAIGSTLNDYLKGNCKAQEAAYDVTHLLDGEHDDSRLFIIPSSLKANDIIHILRAGYNADVLSSCFNELIDALELDYLIIDTHPGLNEETLLAIAFSDILLILLRPDAQDYQGTAVTVEVAQELGVENLLIVMNKVPSLFDANEVKAQVETAYNCEVAAILPHSEDLMILASNHVFSIENPDHRLTKLYRMLANRLIETS